MLETKGGSHSCGLVVLFTLRKAQAGLITAQVKANLNADSCSSESEAYEYE